ncbi:MAG TPA: hypothetical protein VFG94_14070 [Acidimicrobiales bacterium]|nr:hypothetical protein [Acidimicrobiales bacterium]
MHVLAALWSVAQDQFDNGIDPDQAETIVIGMMVACAVALVFVFRTIQKVGTRIILSLVLIAVGAGLWIQRENLQDCRGDCECRLFMQDVRVDPGVFCPERL